MIDNRHKYTHNIKKISIKDLCLSLKCEAFIDGEFIDDKLASTLYITHMADINVSKDDAGGSIGFLNTGSNAVAGLGRYNMSLDKSRLFACFVVDKSLTNSKTIAVVCPDGLSPKVAVNNFMKMFYKIKSFSPSIAKTAHIIDVEFEDKSSVFIGQNVCISNAFIGKGAFIGHNSVIENSTIEESSYIEDSVSIKFADIGKKTTVEAGTRIGGRGFGTIIEPPLLTPLDHIGRVKIGSDVSIGNNSTIDRGMINNTVIKDMTQIDNSVQIAHGVELGKGCLVASHTAIGGSCSIGNGVMIGGGTLFADHIVVPDFTKFLGGAMVAQSIKKTGIYGTPPVLADYRTMLRIVSAVKKLGANKYS
ncbi:MAG: hypothetical protein JJV93_01895 [Alphaproteobacteria bacterium]|nr:hypothetical protein [Alphaproteobacteria bacterium]MBL0717998.1 hypothetical protein [Alphaproteobacteria bacterium]